MFDFNVLTWRQPQRTPVWLLRADFRVAVFFVWWIQFRCGCELILDDYTRSPVDFDACAREDHEGWVIDNWRTTSPREL